VQIETIGLEKLIDHPGNANVMDERLLLKLKGQIRDTGRYEPLVVRVHPKRSGCYELINGHHRKKVLAQLGFETAFCVVWDLSDAEALLLLLTLNRLSGRDDLSQRAKLLAQLQDKIGDSKLLKALPETRERLAQVLALNHPPAVLDPKALSMPLEAMTFFVTETQKEVINSALVLMKQPDEPLNRSEQLEAMARVVLEQ